MKKTRFACRALVCLFISLFIAPISPIAAQTAFAQNSVVEAVSQYANLPGKYRKIFFLPQAVRVGAHNYKIDTLIELGDSAKTLLAVMLVASRESDEFQLVISVPGSNRLITSQTFYMNGEPSETWSFNSWFPSHSWFSRKKLDQLLWSYFGITVPRY